MRTIKLHLSPIRMDAELSLERQGSTLRINGEVLDLSGPEDSLAHPWFAGPAESDEDGALVIRMLFPLPAMPSPPPPEAAALTHPEPITVTEDGPISLPVWTPPPDSGPPDDDFMT